MSKPLRLGRPSDNPNYDHDLVAPVAETAPVPAGPSKKLPWQSTLVERGRAEGMSPACQHIALVLSTFSDVDGTSVRPSGQRLADISGRSKSTVTRSLRYLREQGWIEQVSRGSGITRQASLYRLTIPT